RSDVHFDWTDGDWTVDRLNTIVANEVPYLFCSDEFAGFTPTCKRFDFGANHREMQAASRVNYWNYKIFYSYLRNRLNLDFNRVITKAATTFGDTLTTYQYWYLYRTQYPDFL